MRTKIISFEATIRWAKVFEHNRDLGETGDNPKVSKMIQDRGGKYVIDCYPTAPDEVKRLFDEAGVEPAPLNYPIWKANENGEYLQLKRWHNPPTDSDGNPIDVLGGPPIVVDADNNTWDPEIPIGNESVCEIVVDVWGGGNLRLRAVKVMELVDYNAVEVDPALAWAMGDTLERN